MKKYAFFETITLLAVWVLLDSSSISRSFVIPISSALTVFIYLLFEFLREEEL